MRSLTCLTGVGLVCLLAGGFFALPADSSTTTPTAVGIHMFSGMQGNTSATQSDAIAAASMSDIVSGLTVQIKQYGTAMRQANPNVQLYLYVNGELAQSKDCSTFPASWYLYSTSGAKVKSPNGNRALYPRARQRGLMVGGKSYSSVTLASARGIVLSR